ncbi:MAG TPA: Ig-like domain-containing protein, partial [Candidatus Limnocylindria bacterium]|nr:Ig-like domain-containing protein [Candidatus Limnocylindria bacterium]
MPEGLSRRARIAHPVRRHRAPRTRSLAIHEAGAHSLRSTFPIWVLMLFALFCALHAAWGANSPPVANSNTYTATQNVERTVAAPGVLGNDTDPNSGTVLRAYLVAPPTNGSVTLNTNGSFVYMPQTDYTGKDAFTYRASDGSLTSGVATVTLTVLPTPVAIVTPPKNQTNCIGDTAIFSVTATGEQVTYQWLKGTTILANQTNSTLMLANITTAAAGAYSVRVTNAANGFTNNATLTVNTPVNPPALTNLTRFVGSIAIFHTATNGTGPVTVSWLKDGEVIPGKTNTSLVLNSLLVSDSGTYSAVVKGACGPVTNSATLLVAPCFSAVDVMLVIDYSASMLGQPYTDARTACTNFVRNLQLGPTNDMAGFVIFNRTSSLRQPLTNNQSVLEQTISAFPSATGGTCISCGLTNGQAALYSPRHRSNALPVLVLMSDGLPKAEDGDSPSSVLNYAQQAKNAGTRVFTVGLGAVDFSLMAAAASSTNDFFYTTNSSQLGSLFDAISTIICRPPTNIFGPSNVVVCAGTPVDLHVTASGCDSFTYQWRKDGDTLPGQTNHTISFPITAAADAGLYSVVVSSACRIVTNSASLVVNTPAQIVSSVENQIGFVGSNVTFSVSASGTALSYEWSYDGAVVGTNSTLTLNNLMTNQAGTYCVTVTGGVCGGPVTNCAALTFQNRAPLANDDSYITSEDTTLNIGAPGVLVNDSDPDGDMLGAIFVTQPAHGIVTLNGGGDFSYTPSLNYNGLDSFTYRASDGTLTSPAATVNITVTPLNDVPVANNDAYTMTADTVLTIAAPGILANDTDVENYPLSVIFESGPTHGTLTLSASGSFLYTPNSNYSGSDSFTYRASDGGAASGVATVTITIQPVPIVIVAPPIHRTNCPGETATFSVTATGTALTYQWLFGSEVLASRTNSTLVLPNVNATNAGNYCVIVRGAAGGPVTHCAMLVVNENVIVVTPPADQIVCENALAQFTVNATGTALAYQWYFGATALTNETASTLTLSNVSLSAVGTYVVVVSGICGTPVTNSATLMVNQNVVVVTAPTNRVSFVSSNVTFEVVAIGTDLSYQCIFNGTLIGTNSTLTLNNLATNQAGVYCVNVSGICGSPVTNCATLIIENRPPIASDDAYTMNEDTVLTIAAPGVLVNDSDIDGDTLTAVLVTGPAHGTLNFNGNGAFVYTPSLSYTGVDAFTYFVNDTKLTSAAATVLITVLPLNDIPLASDDAFTTTEDNTLRTVVPGILGNDSDVDGDTLSSLLVANVAHGTLSLFSNGAFIYTPSLSYTGIDTFTYRAT